MPVVRADVSPAPYDTVVEPGLIGRVGKSVRALSQCPKVGLVTDLDVSPLYLKTVSESLTNVGIEPIIVTLPTGEDHKQLADLLPAYDKLLGARIDRETPILALGGGVVGDMTGFLAATILRGVPFIQIPTTLLSMVDASVGGKTGVNHSVGKNLIGAFHQPIAVFIDPEVLKTLPLRELRSGLAECIKHDIIRDTEGFGRLERDIGKALSLDMEFMTALIAHNVSIKARVVEADPFERAERAQLNFGHTFGHAIETVSNYAYAHGECVALGMVAASRAAVELKMLDNDSCRRIISVISAAGIPIGGMKLDPAAVCDAMYFDKKVKSGRLRFVLPDRIGHVVIRDDVPADIVKRAVDSLRG